MFTGMTNGEVKWFNETKGFGFIATDHGDVMVHWSAIQTEGFKTLAEGDKVCVSVGVGQKGMKAEKVWLGHHDFNGEGPVAPKNTRPSSRRQHQRDKDAASEGWRGRGRGRSRNGHREDRRGRTGSRRGFDS